MEYVTKLEHIVQGWFKGAPHLPVGARKWFTRNIWWIILIGAIANGISVLILIGALFGDFAILGGTVVSYYASPTFITQAIIKASVALVFTAITCVLFFMAVSPLRQKQKKGWTLVFIVLLLSAVSTVIDSLITFNPFSFISGIIFGALWLAIGAYFTFEIRTEFAHVERSKGVKKRNNS